MKIIDTDNKLIDEVIKLLLSDHAGDHAIAFAIIRQKKNEHFLAELDDRLNGFNEVIFEAKQIIQETLAELSKSPSLPD